MMSNIYIKDTPEKTLMGFAQRRLYDIPSEIRALEDEKTMLEGLLEIVPPCRNCKGVGKIRDIDHTKRIDNGVVDCTKCKGTGIQQSEAEK